MLRIREEQMAVFRKYMLKQFENRMVDHLYKYFPEECEALGEEEVREAIRYGIDQADSYGIIIEDHVSKYINLMFLFGRDFDKALVWAKEILTDEEIRQPPERVRLLYKEAEQHLSEAVRIHQQERRA